MAADPNLQVSKQEVKAKQDVKVGAKDKIDQIMRKREKKLLDKAQSAEKKKSSYLTEEDKQIVTAAKNKKREVRRLRSKEAKAEDPFDAMLETYKEKVLGKIKEINKLGESGATFQEVDVDSD